MTEGIDLGIFGTFSIPRVMVIMAFIGAAMGFYYSMRKINEAEYQDKYFIALGFSIICFFLTPVLTLVIWGFARLALFALTGA